jgi:hypothetical protein
VALSSFATGSGTTADSLGALFAAFHGKYVALDLSGCTETEIGNADATAAQNRPDKDKLVSLVLPELVSIGSNIFCYANGLVSVNVSHVGKLGINAFAHCTALTKVDLSGLTTGETLGSSAFNDCTALSSVVLSSAVTRIKSSAFSGCTSLTALELPASVAKIATWAFLNCSGFSTLIINKTDGVVTLESPATGSKEGVFHNTAAALTIYVPDALVETYKTATNWSAIVDKIKGHSALPE